MRRRDFVSLLAAVAAWPLAAKANGTTPLIGILDPDVPFFFDAFVQGMRDLGYVEGQNVVYVRKSVQGKFDTVSALASELAGARVDIIVTVAESNVRAIQRTAPSIPVVFLASGDPVSAGLVESLAHPGGRTTGLTFIEDDLSAKRLDLLRQMVPGLRDVSVFYAAAAGKGTAFDSAERTARMLGIQVHGQPIESVDFLEPAFQSAANAHFEAVDVLGGPFFNANRQLLARLAEKYRLPAIYPSAEFARAGGLMAYGPVFVDMGRRGAVFVDKIIKGADPGGIPVEVATKFALTINLKAAAALGLAVPPTLLAGADEVIE
jgi:ABC-type uncharacterized transport system substrate-binding protein